MSFLGVVCGRGRLTLSIDDALSHACGARQSVMEDVSAAWTRRPWEAPKSVGQSGSARFSFNRSGPGLQPDTTARTSPQRTLKGSRPDLQYEMRPTVFGALLLDLLQIRTSPPCKFRARIHSEAFCQGSSEARRGTYPPITPAHEASRPRLSCSPATEQGRGPRT